MFRGATLRQSAINPLSMLICAGLVAMDHANTGYAQPPGLIAYWPFNEGGGSIAHDVSGNGNHGTISGAEWVGGSSLTGLEISGTDIVSYISSGFDDAVGDSITLSMWVYWNGPHPGTYSPRSYVFDARDFSSPCGGFILFIEPSGKVVLQVTRAGCSVFIGDSLGVVPVNAWTHIAAILDYPATTPPPREIRIYLNGALDQASLASSSYQKAGDSAAIGNNRWSPGDGQYAPLNGVLDELMIFNRALTGAEIADLAGPPDCNQNGIPDNCDISCGEPGGPCDVPGCGLSPDCNANAIPDECEWDCNHNGVPDDCDIDPIDPDGNGVVSADDNLNGIPDECDVDCNGNAIQDACDLDCGDVGDPCNVSGCGQSQDCNANLIPDECEEPLGFLLDPVSQTVVEGNSVTMSATATGPPPLQIQWLKNGIDIPGATLESYSVPVVALADAGRYNVTVTCGSTVVTSRSAILTVQTTRAKWPQGLQQNAGPEADYYGAWAESGYTRHQIAADDWACIGGEPVTEIIWWGTYRHLINGSALVGESAPGTDPLGFRIAIWSNVSAGPGQPWSHPGTVLREWSVSLDQLDEHWVGTQYHPTVGNASVFQYHFAIPQGQWFAQDQAQGVYWISIAAQYLCLCAADLNLDNRVTALDIALFNACDVQPSPPVGRCQFADTDCDGDVDGDDLLKFQCQLANPFNPFVCCAGGGDWPANHLWVWNWSTRRPTWNGAAVAIMQPTAPTQGSTYTSGLQIQDAEGPWDLAFSLVTSTAPQPQGCCLPGPNCIDGLLPWQCVRDLGGVPSGAGLTCVSAPPAISQPPQSAARCVGSSVSFNVTATGALPLTYQWEKNGIPITGENAASLVLSPVNSSNAGTYSVRVTNSCGTVLSEPATLSVYATGSADIDLNGIVDGLDVQRFVRALIDGPPPLQPWCAADMDADGDIDTTDMSLFMDTLLGV